MEALGITLNSGEEVCGGRFGGGTDGPGGGLCPPGRPHCFRLWRYGRRNFRPIFFSTEDLSAEKFFGRENLKKFGRKNLKISAEKFFD